MILEKGTKVLIYRCHVSRRNWAEEMDEYVGKEVTIRGFTNKRDSCDMYRIEEDEGMWSWRRNVLRVKRKTTKHKLGVQATVADINILEAL